MKYKWWNLQTFLIIFLLIGFIIPSIVVSSKKHVSILDISHYKNKDYFDNWYLPQNNPYEYIQNKADIYWVKQEEIVPADNLAFKTTKNYSDCLMNPAWPALSHDALHTGRSSYNTFTNSGTELWRIKGYYPGVVWSSPIIDQNNIIYFNTIGGDSALYAIYQNGSIKWRYQSDGRIWCTPTIAEDGTIYFTTWGGYGYLHAVNPNGTKRWLYHDGYDSSSLSSPTIGNDGTIYFGSEEYKIYAINPDGSEKWRYPTDYIIMSSPAIGNDNTIYIGSGDYYLYALYPNGTLQWRFHTGGEIKGSPTIAPDGTIYVPSFDGYLYALYPNGTKKWQVSTGDNLAAAGIALADDGTIYVGTEILRAYYPDGTLKWTTNVQGLIYGTVPAVSADGNIYISAGGSLVALNSHGTEQWRKQLTTTQIHSSPCIDKDGKVYVGSETDEFLSYGFLHAFGLGPLRAEANGPYHGVLTEPLQFTGEVFGGIPPYTFFHWDFGDGYTSDFQNPSHIYNHRGNYTATFTVTDDSGNQSTDISQVEIDYPLPKISIIKPINALYIFNLKIFNLPAPIVIGRITIIANVTQVDADIDRVEFYYSGELKYTAQSPPYQWIWKGHPPPYDQDFMIRAYDTVGNFNDKMIYITKLF